MRCENRLKVGSVLYREHARSVVVPVVVVVIAF